MKQSSLIKLVREINNRSVKEFGKTIGERRKHRKKYPTEIGVTKCMDGRIHLPRITGIPFGIFTPFRNIGGRYRLGWPLMQESLRGLECYAHSKRRPASLVVTFHWSDGDPHRGCAGFNYDTNAAKEHMLLFQREVRRGFGDRLPTVIFGIETDEDAIVILDQKGEQSMDMRLFAAEAENEQTPRLIRLLLADTLPTLPKQIGDDLLPILLGNARHIRAIRQNGRKKEHLVHQEKIIALGQGFDWLSQENVNLALIIGPCDPNLDEPIVKATKIIQTNRKKGRVTEDKALLLVSTPFRDTFDRALAVERSRYLAEFALEQIQLQIPEMSNVFDVMVGVTDLNNRKFEEVEYAI